MGNIFKLYCDTKYMQIVTEGKAKFMASVDEAGKISRGLDVFYNPMMKFGRDVSILLLNAVGEKDIQIADIMAGSGVRSLRFLLELDDKIIKRVAVNDKSAGFIELFKDNLKLNGLGNDSQLDPANICNKDANQFLLESAGFDYIDIDPFGSPNDFLESSIVRLSRRGILAITATDTAPLSGTYKDACIRKYWARPLHNHMMHEAGLRILIRRVQLIGASHDKALVPIYAYFKDHYFRIFFRCEKNKTKLDKLLQKHQYILYCKSCLNFQVSKINCGLCGCGKEFDFAGPLWTGDIFDDKLSKKVYDSNTDNSIKGFLEIVSEESKISMLGFYNLHDIAKKYKFDIPKTDYLISKIKESGHMVSRTHFSRLGIKTDISITELVSIMKNDIKK
jgi:tRNA (guanine26-N2/guanine27-N2)-dimethyltransferase